MVPEISIILKKVSSRIGVALSFSTLPLQTNYSTILTIYEDLKKKHKGIEIPEHLKEPIKNKGVLFPIHYPSNRVYVAFTQNYVHINRGFSLTHLEYILAFVLIELGGDLRNDYDIVFPDWMEFNWDDPRIPEHARVKREE